MKYRVAPTSTRYSEYIFKFTQSNLEELSELDLRLERVFIVLICGEAKEICCFPYETFIEMIAERMEAKGEDEDDYTVLVTAPPNQQLQVYINYPDKKNTIAGQRHIVSRDSFPKCLFRRR